MHVSTHCEFDVIGRLWPIKLEVLKVGEVVGGSTASGSKPPVLLVLGDGIHIECIVTHTVAHAVQKLAEVSLRASEWDLANQTKERGGNHHVGLACSSTASSWTV